MTALALCVCIIWTQKTIKLNLSDSFNYWKGEKDPILKLEKKEKEINAIVW